MATKRENSIGFSLCWWLIKADYRKAIKLFFHHFFLPTPAEWIKNNAHAHAVVQIPQADIYVCCMLYVVCLYLLWIDGGKRIE